LEYLNSKIKINQILQGMVQVITRLIKVMALAFKRNLHANTPPPKLAMGLQHVNLTSNKNIASQEEHE
jgi:hypothetical protein